MLRTCFLFLLFTSATVTCGQSTLGLKSLFGKKFISQKLEYLEILNDSLLYSSISPNDDTASYFLRNDTIYIKNTYFRTDQTGTKLINELHDHRILSLTADTIQLKNEYHFKDKPDDWEDPLVFVNVENLKEPVNNFEFLKLDFSSPWSGTRHIIIKGSGKVTFIDSSYDFNHPSSIQQPKTRYIHGQLTQKELTNFKNLLSKSLLSKLPSQRDCPIDGAISNFIIKIGSKTIVSTGCNLSWPHIFLFNYVYEITSGKGFINQRYLH